MLFVIHFPVNWNNIRQIIMGNNLYNKPLAKNKLFSLESLRTFIGFTYLYVICLSVTVSLGHVSKKVIAKSINPIIAC